MSRYTPGRILDVHERDCLMRRFIDGNTSACADILALRDENLVRQAARSDAPLNHIKGLLAGKDSWPSIEQAILEEAAGSGKGTIVCYILQQNPSMILSESVRYFAVRGSVPVWKELVAHDPMIVNVEIGHFGDALGLAVAEDDIALVQFLLDSGVNVEKSNSITMPVLAFARQEGVSQDIIKLLLSRGAK